MMSKVKAIRLSGNILLADDEAIILIFVKAMLEHLGFTVHTAVNGQEAVNKVRKQDIDFCAVILDVQMPGRNGIEAMDTIRKIDATLPILLISGYSEDDILFHENKPDGFIPKPIGLSDMRTKLEKVLS